MAVPRIRQQTTVPSPSNVRTVARIGLGAMLLFTGIAHLTFGRKQFVAQVPKSLPFDTDLVVVSSGIVELVLGSALVVSNRRRVPVGLMVAALFVAVFPGNISQYLTRRSAFGLNTDKKRFARLFFQPVLVAWALWSTNASVFLRSRLRDERLNENGDDLTTTRLTAPAPDTASTGAMGPHAPGTDRRLVTGEVDFGDYSMPNDFDTITDDNDEEQGTVPGHGRGTNS